MVYGVGILAGAEALLDGEHGEDGSAESGGLHGALHDHDQPHPLIRSLLQQVIIMNYYYSIIIIIINY